MKPKSKSGNGLTKPESSRTYKGVMVLGMSALSPERTAEDTCGSGS